MDATGRLPALGLALVVPLLFGVAAGAPSVAQVDPSDFDDDPDEREQQLERQAEGAMELLRLFAGSILALGGVVALLERLAVSGIPPDRRRRSADPPSPLDRSNAIRIGGGLLACWWGTAIVIGGSVLRLSAWATFAGAAAFGILAGLRRFDFDRVRE